MEGFYSYMDKPGFEENVVILIVMEGFYSGDVLYCVQHLL